MPLPKFFEAQNKYGSIICVANVEIGEVVVNYIVEHYEMNCYYCGGIPAAGNGWHVRPALKERRAKKPYEVEVLDAKRLSMLIDHNYDGKVTEL